MAEKYFPFNSVSGDRTYHAEDFAAYFGDILSSGVSANGDNLGVTSAGGLTISVGPGFAWIKGHLYENEKTKPLTIKAGTPLPRIDRVVARLMAAERKIETIVIEGTPASSPEPPALVRTGDYYDICLADIAVASGAILITDAVITDKRTDPDVCGVVRCLAEKIDVSAFMNNSRAEFEAWLANLQYMLGGDVAGHLQNQIDGLRQDLDNEINAIRELNQVGDIVTTIRQLPDGQYVPCVGQELDTGAYPETAGLQKTPVVFGLAGNAASYATGVYLTADGKGLVGTNSTQSYGRIYYSENYGESWVTAETDSYSSSSYPVYLWANGRGLYRRNSVLYYADNFRGTWTSTGINDYGSECFLSDGHGVMTRNNTAGLYYTSDYGKTWTRSNVTTTGACAIVTGGRGFAYSSGVLYTTTNYGVLWSARGSSVTAYTNIILKDNGRGLCRVGSSLHHTSDYGETWTPCAGLPTGDSLIFSLLDNGRGAAIVRAGTVATPYYTGDYGATWSLGVMGVLQGDETLSSVTLAAFGGGLLRTSAGTLYTRDFGQTWARLSDVSLPPFLLDNGRGILGGQYTCNFKLIAPVQANGYMKVRSL